MKYEWLLKKIQDDINEHSEQLEVYAVKNIDS
jgi:hypothetical protein